MAEPISSEPIFSFQPGLNLLRITQRRLGVILAWLVWLGLIFFGLFGFYSLMENILLAPAEGSFIIFYWSLLADMFTFYLWQRRKEKIKRIRPIHLRAGQEIEISSFLDKSAQQALERAWLFCYRKGYHFLRPIHLLAAFLKDKDFEKVLKRLNCQPKQVIEKTKKILASSSFFPESEKGIVVLGPKIATDFKKVFFDAYYFCLKENEDQIDSLILMWALSQQRNLVGMIFDEFGIRPDEIDHVVDWVRLEKQIRAWEKSFFWERLLKPKGRLNRAMTAAVTPLLDRVGQDLTFLARQGAFEVVMGRESEISQLFNFFTAGKIGVVLVGESEIGRKAILKKIAQLMVEESIPKFLQDKRLVKLDLAGLVGLSGAHQRGEEYFKRIIFEVRRAGNIVLVIDDIDHLVGLKTEQSSLDFAELLASSLSNQEFFLISTATAEGFANKIEGGMLGRVLNKIEVGLPSRDLLWQILVSKVYIIEKELDILFSADALDQVIDLADRYLYGKALPAKAMDLLIETAYWVRNNQGKGALVKAEEVTELVAQKTKIPLTEVQETEKEKLLNLEDLIHQRLIDQEEAVKAVASALRRSRLQLQEQKKPICNFLFIGPTGVGKTELARTLAAVYFGDEKRMLRFDMSEYQEKRSIRNLIGIKGEQGASHGYLTEAVKRQPYSLLLLDEVEKAHADILNLFLQVMDDGRLTDASGETINFTNIILIATSNAGTHFIQEKIKKGAPYHEIDKELKEKVLLEYFRPELLNRFDKIVLFEVLTMENMDKITRLFLNRVKETIAEKGVFFSAEEEAIEELIQLGFDPLYGARPLKRVIQDKIEEPMARLFLENKLKRRDTLILKKGFVFEIKQAPEI